MEAERVYALGNFTEGTTLFTEVDDETDATALCATNALFDGVGEVGLARANVRSEDIRAVT